MEPLKRKVVTRSPSRSVRIIHLPHIAGNPPVEAESSLEYKFVHISGLFPRLESIVDQPFKLALDDGKSYTPDFAVRFLDGSTLIVEVKPLAMLEAHHHKLLEAQKKLEAKGMQFLLATDQLIENDGLDQRARLCHRYAKSKFDQLLLDAVSESVQKRPDGVQVKELMSTHHVPAGLIFHLMATGLIYTKKLIDTSRSAVLYPVSEFFKEHDHEVLPQSIQFKRWFDPQGWYDYDRAHTSNK